MGINQSRGGHHPHASGQYYPKKVGKMPIKAPDPQYVWGAGRGGKSCCLMVVIKKIAHLQRCSTLARQRNMLFFWTRCSLLHIYSTPRCKHCVLHPTAHSLVLLRHVRAGLIVVWACFSSHLPQCSKPV